ncbi:exported protein of unknown function (plasmid) [Cupriavidus taiwanensis]|uniref:Lipoprotein n=1 Tax=Cupriavidus taiwanensis TaxID=164546 RepID=A0A9Q7V1E2_9BURK|nr:hypothetical protein [Cupriavidus taiwanensis]SPD67823.1 exported protein of unknown function [Cupriavidus taiwanensis]
MRSIVHVWGLAAIAVVSISSSPAHATKCRSGKSILYTQEQGCPPGYTDITSSMGGNLSTYSAPTTVTRHSNNSTTIETTRAAPYSPARCQRLQVDRNMLGDQLRRTGWKLEQDNVRAQLMQIEEEMAARGC